MLLQKVRDCNLWRVAVWFDVSFTYTLVKTFFISTRCTARWQPSLAVYICCQFCLQSLRLPDMSDLYLTNHDWAWCQKSCHAVWCLPVYPVGAPGPGLSRLPSCNSYLLLILVFSLPCEANFSSSLCLDTSRSPCSINSCITHVVRLKMQVLPALLNPYQQLLNTGKSRTDNLDYGNDFLQSETNFRYSVCARHWNWLDKRGLI